MAEPQAIAHAAQDKNGVWREPHELAAHLREVAQRAAQQAAHFNASDWAYLAGLWHDLGKYRPRFQRYIRKASGFEADAHIRGEAGKAPHSTAGALLARERFGLAGQVLAYLIASHHAGLYDYTDLASRLQQDDSRAELNEALAAQPPADILDHSKFTLSLQHIPGGKDGFALWVRLLFSCLVDADFLDTEAYMDVGQAERRQAWPTLISLCAPFDAFIDALMAEKAQQAAPTPINALRADILAQCRNKAQEAPGLFSLTVPTGGGKTLSSLAFALEHAKHHHKRRVIYVIPYTSIIEQTANIFRGIFGDVVVEHHSNAESDPEKEQHKSRLACENWDAPLIVTTNVQFFESLFAAKTSRCRKLHNIVDSIVVLDEAQLLPTDFLQPILHALKLLTTHYGVSVVLSTATQPALSTRSYFDAKNNLDGLDNVREIMRDPAALYAAFDQRVKVHLPSDWHSPTPWDELAARVAQDAAALVIVNRRQDARELWQRLPQGSLHLSALMCGQHRSDLIQHIKQRLKEKISTRVVSTQLIEAGVDVDFPVVYRALAGLDSIAQAAGRCNREQTLAQGDVVVFIAPQPAPAGYLRKAEDACREVLQTHTGEPLQRELFARYFTHLYRNCNLDAQQITQDLTVDATTLGINFRSAAAKFQLIPEDGSTPVIVRYRGLDGTDDTINSLLNRLKKEGPQRWLMRKLQRYTVTVRQHDAQRLLVQGDIEEHIPGLFIQVSDWLYDPNLGLMVDGKPLGLGEFVVCDIKDDPLEADILGFAEEAASHIKGWT